MEKVTIDYNRLCLELEKQGKTKADLSRDMTKNKNFVGLMEKNPDQPGGRTAYVSAARIGTGESDQAGGSNWITGRNQDTGKPAQRNARNPSGYYRVRGAYRENLE